MVTRIIRTEADAAAISALIHTRKMPMTVTIADGVNRTNAQNKLQRKWCNEVAQQLGDRTAEEVRGDAKLRFGVPILRAENDDFCEKYDRLIKPRSYAEKLELMMEPIDFPITRLMNANQKTRYLDAFYAHYSAQGVRMTIPGADE